MRNDPPTYPRPPTPPESRICCGVCGVLKSSKHTNWLCRKIPTHKSVINNEPDCLSELFGEAAGEISRLRHLVISLTVVLDVERNMK